jgi:hypothetical protein
MKIRFYQSDMSHTTSIRIDWPAWFGDFLHQCHRWKQYGFRKGFLSKPWKKADQWTPEEIGRMKARNARPLDINKIKAE